jgi:hypothetical protein
VQPALAVLLSDLISLALVPGLTRRLQGPEFHAVLVVVVPQPTLPVLPSNLSVLGPVLLPDPLA